MGWKLGLTYLFDRSLGKPVKSLPSLLKLEKSLKNTADDVESEV